MQPPVLPSVRGRLAIELEVVPHRATVDGALSFTTRAFSHNGAVLGLLGPTWAVRAGDRVDVTLRNRLGANNPTDSGIRNTFRSLNTTNLHTHGLHISPEVDSMFVHVEPGEEHVYAYTIPGDHAPGTFWYHSHVHGATTQHTMGGLVGAIVMLPNTPDSSSFLPGDLGTADTVMMLLNHLKFDPINDHPTSRGDGLSQQFKTWSFSLIDELSRGLMPPDPVFETPDLQDIYTVNGQYQPFLGMRPGELKVFEVINAGSGGHMLELSIRDGVNEGAADVCDWWIISSDGVYLETPRRKQEVGLVQAGRFGLAVQCSHPGTFFFQTSSVGRRNWQPEDARYAQNLVTLVVAGEPRSMTMPTGAQSLVTAALPRPAGLEDLRDVTVPPGNIFEMSVDNVDAGNTGIFWMGFGSDCMLPCEGRSECAEAPRPEHSCNHSLFRGEQGDPTQPGWTGQFPYVGKVGEVHEMVINGRIHGLHPIHVHVNHFQIVAYNGSGDLSLWGEIGDWRDVVPALPGRLTVRWYAAYLPGEITVHCHILRHEDRGMMATFYLWEDSSSSGTRPETTTAGGTRPETTTASGSGEVTTSSPSDSELATSSTSGDGDGGGDIGTILGIVVAVLVVVVAVAVTINRKTSADDDGDGGAAAERKSWHTNPDYSSAGGGDSGYLDVAAAQKP